MRDRVRRRLEATIIAIVTTISLGVPAIPPRSYGASAAWPNEPAGFTVVTDWPFTTLTGGGWGNLGGSYIVSDAGAALSPANVAEFPYRIGFTGGVGADNVYYTFPASKGPQPTELYVGYWWKPSNPWQGHSSGVNKISFHQMDVGGTSNTFSKQMYGLAPPYFSRITLSFPTSNGHLVPSWGDDPGSRNLIGNNIVLTLGVWHRIEICAKFSTSPTSRDGIVKWWVDGAVGGDYTTVNYPGPGHFVEFDFAPTWGGVGDTKTQNDFYWYDHVHISTGSGTGSGCLGTSSQFPQPPINVTAG